MRADVRIFVRGSGLTTTIDASPTVERSVPSIALPSRTSPSVQFSTTATDRSSLSGSASGLHTFAGGLDTRIVFTVGYFVRF